LNNIHKPGDSVEKIRFGNHAGNIISFDQSGIGKGYLRYFICMPANPGTKPANKRGTLRRRKKEETNANPTGGTLDSNINGNINAHQYVNIDSYSDYNGNSHHCSFCNSYEYTDSNHASSCSPG
jgi:hypothetical protein